MATLHTLFVYAGGALPSIPLSFIFAIDIWHAFALTFHAILRFRPAKLSINGRYITRLPYAQIIIIIILLYIQGDP